MSITDLIPALKGTGRRRAADKVDELRRDLTAALTNLHAAGDEIALLRNDLTDARRKQTDADVIIVAQLANLDRLTVHRDELLTEVTALKERFGPELAAEANANRIDVPRMARIGADQETVPQGIDVTTLWAARDAGLLGPVTDPGHIGPDDDTQPLPAA